MDIIEPLYWEEEKKIRHRYGMPDFRFDVLFVFYFYGL